MAFASLTLVLGVAVVRRRVLADSALAVAGLAAGFGWWLLVMVLQGEPVGDFEPYFGQRARCGFRRALCPRARRDKSAEHQNQRAPTVGHESPSISPTAGFRSGS